MKKIRGLFFKNKKQKNNFFNYNFLPKKRRADEMLFPVIIFIMLNLIFCTIFLTFVYTYSTGASVYEQAYAKEIALLIDKAKPTTQIFLNFEKGFEIAKKNKISKENLVSGENNQVIVKLSNSRGYVFEYFSDYDVNFYPDKENENNLIIIIREKGEENE